MAEAGAGYGWYLAASWTQATTVFKVTGRRRTRETGGNPANGETKKKNKLNHYEWCSTGLRRITHGHHKAGREAPAKVTRKPGCLQPLKKGG
jgi:hypothetical protein